MNDPRVFEMRRQLDLDPGTRAAVEFLSRPNVRIAAMRDKYGRVLFVPYRGSRPTVREIGAALESWPSDEHR